jgi:MoaA/NifB/PqqE/SkfB family radical SAM enzyme
MSTKKRTLSIEVKMTDRCNQQCPYCANRDGLDGSHDIDSVLFVRRLEEWARGREDSVYDIKEVRLTGGEPLIDLDAVFGVAECCRKLNIRSGVNTNGLLLNPDRIRRLKESGVEVVKISFDAVSPETYRLVRGPISSLDPLRDTIRELVANRFKVIMRFTLLKPNHDQLLAAHVLAEGLGVYKFQVKPLIRSGRAEISDAFLSPGEVDEALRELSRARAGTSLSTEVLCWPPAHGVDFFHKICGSIDKIYVSLDMAVTFCNYIWDDRQVPLGDLSRSPLEDILRRRHAGEWSERAGRHEWLKGCPNSGHFTHRPD